MSLTAIFFDVGNTLLFAIPEKTLAPLAARRIPVAQEQLYAAERAAKHFLDAARARHESVDAKYWEIYYGELLRQLGQNDSALQSELVVAARTSGNWRRVLPQTRPVLLRLKQRFRLGVISNSDGGIQRLLEGLGLGDCFDTFTDSALVGCEKPDLRIFHAALASLKVQPPQSLYVGDIYSVDYLGARAAGMHAVLMDAAGTNSSGCRASRRSRNWSLCWKGFDGGRVPHLHDFRQTCSSPSSYGSITRPFAA